MAARKDTTSERVSRLEQRVDDLDKKIDARFEQVRGEVIEIKLMIKDLNVTKEMQGLALELNNMKNHTRALEAKIDGIKTSFTQRAIAYTVTASVVTFLLIEFLKNPRI